jgi:hypothetical protein
LIDDPDYWRERASNARDDAEQASDPENRRLWLLANEIQALQSLSKPN